MSLGKIKPTYADLEKRVLELEKFHSSLLKMINGFAYCRILYEENNPVDLIFLIVNKSFEVQTGLKNVQNKKLTEIIPGIDNSSPKLFEILRRVSSSGNPERFEIFIEALQFWFSGSVFSPSPENIVAIFDNITESKIAENELRQSEERLKDIIFSIGDWVWEIDENGKYTYT
ncbi:MAG: hypothetical protein ACYC25_11440, partial [Paludibacter sp.]